ncbi:MAG TPA: rhomboid family intramembrane serine protease [Candidatus Cryosericum sp.]|nr:rhomboid family intramembrane serine protease [Candidatus Cryosericum sp.]
MIPIRDDVPTKSFPLVTIVLMVINVGVFVRLMLLPSAASEETVLRLAVIPYELTHVPAGRLDVLGYNILTLVTSMFLHGSLLHLGGNLLYLWIFGNNIEDVMGRVRFLIFYILCGLAGALAQIAVRPASQVPMIGASGAIAGILGAYLVMFPAARVQTLFFFIFFARIVPVPALIVLGSWLLVQLVNAGNMGPGGVAWFAHLGGFLAGLLLIVPFRVRRVSQSLY